MYIPIYPNPFFISLTVFIKLILKQRLGLHLVTDRQNILLMNHLNNYSE